MKKILLILTMLTTGFCNMWAQTVTWESKEGWKAAEGGFGNFKWIGVHTPENASTLYSFKELNIRFRKTGEDNVITDNYLAIARVPSESSLNANHVIAVSNNKMKAEGDNTLQTYTFDDDVVLLGSTTYYLVFVQSNTPTNGSYTVGTSRLTLNHKDYGEYMYGNSGGSTGLNYWIYFGATLTSSAASGLCTGSDLGGSMESGNWKTSWNSGTSPSFTITCPNANFNNSDSKPADGLDIRSGTAKSAKYTINPPTGYIITGYKLFGKALTSSQTVTPSEGGSAVTFTTKGNSISISGLRKLNASFTLTDTDNSGLLIHAMEVSLAPAPSITSLSTANNKAYIITNARRTWNFADNATSMSTVTNADLNDERQQIALIYYNKNYYLYSVNADKFLTAGNALTDIPTDNEQVSIESIGNSTYPWFIKFKNVANKNINITGDGVVKIDSHTTLDEGNRNAIIEAVDFNGNEIIGRFTGYNDLIAQLNDIPWSDTDKAGQVNRYNLTAGSSFSGYAGHEKEMIENFKDGYSDIYFSIAQDMINHYALNMPTTGYYRIKGQGGTNSSNKYLAAGLTNEKFSMTNANDATTIFYYDGTKLKNYSTGLYNGMHKEQWAWVEEDNASVVTFQDGLTNGGYAIKSAQDANGTNQAYFYDDNSNADRGSNMTIATNTDNRYTHWYLEEVTSLPVIPAPGVTDVAKPVLLGNITSASDVTSNITASAKFVDLSQATIGTSIDDIKTGVESINPNAVIIAPEGTSVEGETSNVLVPTGNASEYTCNNLQLNDEVIAQFATDETNFTDTKVTYTRANSASVWGTICLPYATSTEGDISYYRLVESSTSNLSFEKISEANTTANEPYLIKKEAGAGLSVSAEGQNFCIGIAGSQNGSSHNDFKLQGVLVNTSVIDGTTYTIAKSGYDVATTDPNAYYFDATNNTFRKMNGRFNLKAFRAYLTATSANARENIGIDIFDNDQPTGISFVESEGGNTVDVIFDLNGRRLQNAKKGINIINGKKVVK